MSDLNKIITFKVDKKMYDTVKKLATNDGRSVGNYLRLLLSKSFNGKKH